MKHVNSQSESFFVEKCSFSTKKQTQLATKYLNRLFWEPVLLIINEPEVMAAKELAV